MKKYVTTGLKLTTLLLGFCLMPIQQASANLNCTTAACCHGTPGFIWMYGSCKIQPYANANNLDTIDCHNNYDTQEARDNCYLEQAASRGNLDARNGGMTSTGNMRDDGWYYGMMGTDIALTAGYGYMLLMNKKRCRAPDYQIMLVAGAAASGGDLINTIMTRMELKKIEDKYADELGVTSTTTGTANPPNGQPQVDIMGAQVKAFEYLRDEQQIIYNSLMTKGVSYTIAGAAYALAATMGYIGAAKKNDPDYVNYLCFKAKKNYKPDSQADPAPTAPPKKINNKGTPSARLQNAGGVIVPVIDMPFRKYRHNLNLPNMDILQNRTPATTPLDAYFLFEEKRRLEFDQEISSPTLDEYEELRAMNAFDEEKDAHLIQGILLLTQFVKKAASMVMSDAHADLDDRAAAIGLANDPTNATQVSLYVGLAQKAASISGMAMGKPLDRAITNSVLTLSSATVAGFAFGQMEDVQENIDDLDSALQVFRETFVGPGSSYTCTSADRSDPTKPSCYCYDAEGRPKAGIEYYSQACAKEFGHRVAPLLGGKYGVPGQHGQGCVNMYNQPDPQCLCRRNNSCFKVGKKMVPSSMFGGASTLWNSMGPNMSDFLNGNLTAGNTNPNYWAQNAAKLNKVAKKVKAKINKQRKAEGKKPIPFSGLEQKLKRRMASVAKSIPPSQAQALMPGGNRGSSAFSESQKEKVKKALKKAGVENKVKYLTPRGRGGKKKGDDDDFGISVDGFGDKVMQDQAYKDKKYNYGANDINKNGSNSIWDVLSHRYQQSGLRRLFQ